MRLKSLCLKRKITIASLIATIAVVLFGGVMIILNDDSTFAAGHIDSGSSLNGGGCAPAGKTSWFDECYGASWRYYEWGQASETFSGGVLKGKTPVVEGTNQAPGGKIKGCKTVGGVYILGLEVYNPQTQASYGYQRGILRNSDISRNKAGGIPYRDDIAGVAKWDEVKKAFKEAKDAGIPGADSIKWDGSLGYFCYKKDAVKKKGDFKSKSSVEIKSDEQQIVSPDVDYSAESDEDGEVTLKISTRQEKVFVRFHHKLLYPERFYKIANDNTAVVDPVTATWTVNNQDNQSVTSGSTTAVAGGSGQDVTTEGAFYDLQPGETKIVCEEIEYKPQTVVQTKKAIYTGSGKDRKFSHYQYSVSSTSGEGSSSACAEIHRVKDPTITTDGNVSATTSSTGFYAGEQATIDWQANVEAYPSHRLLQRESVAYLLSPDIEYKSDIASGSVYTSSPPVDYARSKMGQLLDWKVFTSDNFEPEGRDYSENFSLRKDVVLPDTVGAKYCHTIGVKMGYWYGIDYSDTGEDATNWYRVDGKDYWVVSNATCRPIAKKPSFSVWNGSIFTNGKVQTSLAPRFDNASFGKVVDEAGYKASDKVTYGSWTEHLGVVGRQNQGLASGSALYSGMQDAKVQAYSPLTISNTDTNNLGYSGINPNASKLISYFEPIAQSSNSSIGDTFKTTAGENPGTRIYKFDGDQTLSDNVELPSVDYKGINEIPQNVIIINGNLNVESNVTKIDAWLIVTGKINTCSSFDTKNTQSNGDCSKQLMINGPVVASGIDLNRSYGADPSAASLGRATSAEIFNLRPDAYLWSYARSASSNIIMREVYTRELAPRY